MIQKPVLGLVPKHIRQGQRFLEGWDDTTPDPLGDTKEAIEELQEPVTRLPHVLLSGLTDDEIEILNEVLKRYQARATVMMPIEYEEEDDSLKYWIGG